MSDLTLYYAIPSRGLVVHWMLEELGVPYRRQVLNLAAEEHKTPAYLAINPMGRVPALRHGDVVVTETVAICTYLAEQFPEAGLNVGVDSTLRGEYLRWLFFGPVTMEPSIVSKAMGFVSPDYQPFADIETVASTLAAQVAGREFIIGDQFTAADVVIGSSINWGLNMMPELPKHPELVEYWSRLAQRPAWQVVQATLSGS